jgi:PAS domain-containing protein
MHPELAYSTPFFISAISIFVVGTFISCHQRRPRGIWYLVALCFAAFLWAATEGMLYLGLDIETNMRIAYLQYLGFTPLPPLLLLFTLSFFRHDAWLNRKTVMGLGFAVAASLLLGWTNPLHQQMYSGYYLIETGPVPMLGLHHGPLWWAMTAYHYALTALVCIILYRTIRTGTGPLRQQAALSLGLICIVWGFNVVYVSGFSPIPNMDPGPLAFTLVTVAMARGFYRHNFLGIHPIAKAAFFSAIKDPILVLDIKKRILDLNPVAEKFLKIRASVVIGRHIDKIPGLCLDLEELSGTQSGKVLPITLERLKRYFELRVMALKDKRGSGVGYILFFHDITERLHADAANRERERLVGVLEIAATVSKNMAQPIRTIIDCSKQVPGALPAGHPDHDRGQKLAKQAIRLMETARKLMGITRYETRQYLGGRIIDIDKASNHSGIDTAG